MLDDRMTALTAQITKMTPQQRQQFALLHKSDPIIIGLTKFINDQEKSLRNAFAVQQAPAALAPKPTVVDQTIAGMAALPAPNVNPPMGGIAGGEESPQGYAGGGGVDDGTDAMFGNPMAADMGMGFVPAAPGAPAVGTSVLEQLRQQLVHPVATPKVVAPAKAAAAKPGAGQYVPPPPQAVAAPAAPHDPLDDILAQLNAKKGAGGGGGGAGISGLPAGGSKLPVAPTAAPMDVQGMYQKYLPEVPDESPAQDKIDEYTQQKREAADEGAKELQDQIAARGQAGTGYEARLNAKEARLDKQEHDNAGLALLDAGLAMMAGTSQYAMVNIGEGGRKGLQSFKEGKDKIEAGRDKVADGLFALERMRRGEQTENDKELLAAHNKARDTVAEGTKMTIEGIMQQHKVDQETATKMLETSMHDVLSQRQLAGNEYHAQMQYLGNTDSARIHAGATMAAANSRNSLDKLQLQATIAQQKQQNAGGMLALNAHNQVLKQLDSEAKLDPIGMTPGSPKYEQRYQQLMQQQQQFFPGLSQFGVTQPSAPAAAPLQGFKVLR